MACTACGGPMVPRLRGVRDPQTGEAFDVLGCARCDLGRTDPIPSALERYYGDAYYGARHGLTERACVRRRLRWLLRAAGARRGRLLDVGCGEGTLLSAAAERGFTTAGVEPGAAAATARAAGHEVFSSVDTLPGDVRFDCVASFHSLEHTRDPGATLATLRARMAADAPLVLAVPNASGLQARAFGRHWLHLDVPRHLHHFGPRSLAALLERTGFAVERRQHLELEYDLAGATQSALDAVLPAPRVLLSAAMGRRVEHRAQLLLSCGLAAATAPLAALAVAAGTLAGAGGTLVVFARAR